MASKRRLWDSLSPAYRGRLSRAGITKTQYQSGVSLQKARGHAETPEHGLKQAFKHKTKFRKYIQRKNVIFNTGSHGTAEDKAYELNSMLDKAKVNVFNRLRAYHKFRSANVIANIYGGIGGPQFEGEGPEEERRGMTYVEAMWTASADTEELRSRAAYQKQGNPWFYH
jgi:hypothetical protein